MKRSGIFVFKPWEFVLIVLAILLLAGSSVVFVTGFSMRRYLLGWNDGEKAEQVGHLGAKTGTLRRQLNSDTEFRDLNASETLFNFDTVVSGPDSTAVLELDDGSTIELGPNTMVKLVFDSQLSLEGIKRRASVEVVAGEVQGQSKSVPIVLKTRDRQIPIDLAGKQKLKVSQAQAPLKVKVAAPTPTPTPTPSPTPSPSPSPTPSPTAVVKPKILHVRLTMVSPKLGEALTVPKHSTEPSRDVTLSWKVDPPDTRLRVTLKRVSQSVQLPPAGRPLPPPPKSGGPPNLLNEVVEPRDDGRASASYELDKPGTYEWELRDEEGKLILTKQGQKEFRSRFALLPEFEGIETLPPLVAGSTSASNEYKGEQLESFNITLRWKPYPKIEEYVIRLADRPVGGQILVQKEVKGATEYSFNKEKVFTGKVFYQILARFDSGFLAASAPQPFTFAFNPPSLVLPVNNAVVTKLMMARNDNSILMTWQKTNFTEGYEIEVASDVRFNKVLLRKRIKENFFVLKSAAPGKYYWRTRSFSRDIASPFSEPFLLNVTR